MNQAFVAYTIVVMGATAIALGVVGINRARRIGNMSGWYMLLFFLTYIVRPAIAEWGQDFGIYFQLGIRPLSDGWVQMAAAVSLSILSFAMAYRLSGGAPRGVSHLPSDAASAWGRHRQQLYFAAGLCIWGYFAMVISGGPNGGFGERTGNDASTQFGVAQGNNTFWVMSSDQFVSSGTILVYLVTRRLSLSIGIAFPWMLARLAAGFGRTVLIGHLVAMLAVWAITKRRDIKPVQLFALLASIVFVVTIIFPTLGRDRHFFENGVTAQNLQEAVLGNDTAESFVKSTQDLAGFETTLYLLQTSTKSAWGTEYLWSYFFKPIPRMIWPNKGFPDSLAYEWLGIEPDPSFFGLAPGSVGGAYRQWGWFGIIGEFALTGWALRRLEEQKDRGAGRTYVLFAYAGFFALLPQLGRDTFLAMIEERWLFAFGIPVAILWYMGKRTYRTGTTRVVRVSGRPKTMLQPGARPS